MRGRRFSRGEGTDGVTTGRVAILGGESEGGGREERVAPQQEVGDQ